MADVERGGTSPRRVFDLLTRDSASPALRKVRQLAEKAGNRG